VQIDLQARDGKLFARAAGEELELAYDSHGDFFPLEEEGLLTPREEGGRLTFVWTSGGIAVPAVRRSR
jgi:hypothetical protein